MSTPLKLDYSLPTAAERTALVSSLLSSPSSTYSPRQLECMTDYILFGKDPDGTSSSSRKEVSIRTRYSSYSRDKSQSLDALYDSPDFSERAISSITSNHYTSRNRTFERNERTAAIPGMKALWDQIDVLSYKLDLYNGTVPPSSSSIPVPTWTPVQAYHAKHHLIELRTQQYYLLDSAYPTLSSSPSASHGAHHSEWDTNSLTIELLPLGFFRSNPTFFTNPREVPRSAHISHVSSPTYTIDLCDPTQLCKLFENELLIRSQLSEEPDAQLLDIMDTVDFFARKASLDPKQLLILEGKKRNWTTEEIARTVNARFSTSHAAKYISTLWQQTICPLIAQAAYEAEEEFDCRSTPSEWKQCSVCGKWFLARDSHFARRRSKKDGFSASCKTCDKRKREQAKAYDAFLLEFARTHNLTPVASKEVSQNAKTKNPTNRS